MRGFGVQVEAVVQFDAFQFGIKEELSAEIQNSKNICPLEDSGKKKKNLDPLYKCIKEIQGIKNKHNCRLI